MSEKITVVLNVVSFVVFHYAWKLGFGIPERGEGVHECRRSES
jgi:hypothetical protein